MMIAATIATTTTSAIFFDASTYRVTCSVNAKNFLRGFATSIDACKPTTVESRVHYNEGLQHEVKKIRETMRSLAREDGKLEELIMIDAIYRLGLEYYFQQEVNGALERHHKKCIAWGSDNGANLHEVALRFRLLRQGGYNVPAGIFNIFKGNDGNFKQELRGDIKGLLSLFEASQLSTRGESIMDEAGEFSEKHLKSCLIVNHFKQPWARMVENTLRNPFHKSIPRVLAEHILEDFKVSLEFLHDLSSAKNWVKDVQNLAEFDYNMAEMSNITELQQISRWVKELNSTKQLNFARIQPWKWYMGPLGTLSEPNMANERMELTKVVSFIYIIDDIFDVYGTLDELFLFTEAVNRWDHADTKPLPDYMKVCFYALRDMVKDISYKTQTKYGWNPEDSLQKSWATLCKSYLVDAKWSASKYLPTSDEYLKNAVVSVGGPVFLTHAFFLLGHGIDKKSVIALNDLPLIVSSASTIFRLWNDIGTEKVENREGNDWSYIDFYMKEHNITSFESARQQLDTIISDAWKYLNEECLSPTSPFSTDFRKACLNLARVARIRYSFDEIHHLQRLQDHLAS